MHQGVVLFHLLFLVEELSFETMRLSLLVVQGVLVFREFRAIQILLVHLFLRDIQAFRVLQVIPLVQEVVV